jgi:hypothetical protein
MSARIKLSHNRGEVAPNTWEDIAWIRQNRNQLYQEFGAVVILVYQQELLGKGQSLEEAIADAETHLPTEIHEVSPVIEFLSAPLRISRVSRLKGKQ